MGVLNNLKMEQMMSTRKLIVISISLQLVLIGLTGLIQLGFDVPVLRQIIGLIYLSFIPGALILKCLKVKDLNKVEYFVYAIGLSISLVMVIGLLINIFYPVFGISKPITTWPVVITFTIILSTLFIIAYYQDKDYKPPLSVSLNLNLKEFISPPYLFLTFLPFLAVAGGLIVTFYHNNIFLLVLIIMISLVPVMVVFDKFIPEKAYPFAVFTIALALLLHVTMVSMYPMRLNVDGEFYHQNLVVQNGYWDIALTHPSNTVLSIVMMAPIFSTILGMNTYWLFKIIYPLIFSLVPLILYSIYTKQLDRKSSFLAVLFFMFIFYFYVEAPLLRRQQIAILYFSLIILLMLNRKLLPIQRVIMAILFSFSLAVSHYSMSYICLIIIIFAYLLYIVIKKIFNSNLTERLKNKITFLDISTYRSWAKATNLNLFTLSFICLYFVFTLTWYMYTGSGTSFANVATLGKHIYMSIGDFLDPSKKSPVIESAFGVGFLTAPHLNKIYRILQYCTQLFIIIGFICIAFRPGKFFKEYVMFSVLCVFFLLVSTMVPYMSIAMNMPRIYFIILILLSPYCIIGGKIIWNYFSRLVEKSFYLLYVAKDNNRINRSYVALIQHNTFLKAFVLVLLVPYFLFNVGFVFAVGGYTEETRDLCLIPSSSSLSYDKVDTGYHTEQEVSAAIKAYKIIDDKLPIYADRWIGFDLVSAWRTNVKYYTADLKMPDKSYAFFRKWNVDKNELRVPLMEEGRIQSGYLNISETQENPFKNRGKIYDNGGAEILGVVYR